LGSGLFNRRRSLFPRNSDPEYLEENVILDVKIQIFGTDVNEKNIEKARQGTYRKSIEDDVSESRLRKFFRDQDDGYQSQNQ